MNGELRDADGRGVPCESPQMDMMAAAPELLSVLRELEWAGERSDNLLGLPEDACPSCKALKHPFKSTPNKVGPHPPDCRLSSLLKRLK